MYENALWSSMRKLHVPFQALIYTHNFLIPCLVNSLIILPQFKFGCEKSSIFDMTYLVKFTHYE